MLSINSSAVVVMGPWESEHATFDQNASSSGEPRDRVHSSVTLVTRAMWATTRSSLRSLPLGTLEIICLFLGFRNVAEWGYWTQIHAYPEYRQDAPRIWRRRYFAIADLLVTLFDTIIPYFRQVAADLRDRLEQDRMALTGDATLWGRTERLVRVRSLGLGRTRRHYAVYDSYGDFEMNRSSGDSSNADSDHSDADSLVSYPFY